MKQQPLQQKAAFTGTVLLMLLMAGCSKTNTGSSFTGVTGGTPPLPAKVILDIPYGNAPRQKMDLWLPEGRNALDTRTIVMIHGGQWSAGDKSQMEFFRTNLTALLPGYAFAAVNYRLAAGGQHLFPTQEQDVNAAIDFLLSRSDSFAIAKKLVLTGESAGGHLALLNGFKKGRSSVKAIVALYAPSDLVALYNNPANTALQAVLQQVTGATPQSNNALYASSSPVNFINNNSPATLLVHGTNDGSVPPAQSTAAGQLLLTNGVTHQVILVPAEGHEFSQPAMQQFFIDVKDFLANSLIFR